MRNQNRTPQDWSADYRFYAQARLDGDKIFGQVRAEIEQCGGAEAPLVAAMDDSLLRKTGRKIFGSRYQRDPLSPPFQVNFVRGLRVLQISAAVRQGDQGAARLIPIDFQHAALPAKPHPRAPAEVHAAYQAERAVRNINVVGRERLASLRQQMDQSGSAARRLVVSLAGRFTNSTVLRKVPDRTVLVGRVRKDSVFFYPPTSQPQRGRKRKYGLRCPTPEALLKDPTVPWQSVKASAAGQTYEFKVKTLGPVYTAMNHGLQALRLVVREPVPYRASQRSKLERREPAYLICTDPDSPCRNWSKIICGAGTSKSISGMKKPSWAWARPKCAQQRPTRMRPLWRWRPMPCCCWLPSKPMARRASPTPFRARSGTNANPNNAPPPTNWSTNCGMNSGPTPSKPILPASPPRPTPTRTALNAITRWNPLCFYPSNETTTAKLQPSPPGRRGIVGRLSAI